MAYSVARVIIKTVLSRKILDNICNKIIALFFYVNHYPFEFNPVHDSYRSNPSVVN